ncbi:MAG: polyprenyl synthetase family protein [Deltaproteobacteria bacterium]|nr:polyprenyl synthetase family protein [Deltaproteobacteria bacterium]
MSLLETPVREEHAGEHVTLSRLDTSALKGGDPAVTRTRLASLRELTEGELDKLDALLPRLCTDAPRDVCSAARHLLCAGGKRVRPLLVFLSSRAAGLEPPAASAVRQLAIAAELVHNATLLHDDVIDDALRRRGQVAARVLWGNTVSVLGGDFLLVRALELVQASEIPGALISLLAVIRRMVEGEALQLDRRGKLDPDEEAYRAVADAKTASLFGWCGRAGALAARADHDIVRALHQYGVHLGRAFQIVDDVLDLAGDSAALGKDLLGDLREGKLTLPVLVALRRDPSLSLTLAKAAEATDEAQGAELAAAVAKETARTGALDVARAEAVAETNAACAALDIVPKSPYREALAGIARELAQRGC